MGDPVVSSEGQAAPRPTPPACGPSRRRVDALADSTVLVVDDEPSNLASLAALLRGRVAVRVASSGHRALELAARQAPDLVLLDVDMPDLDGFQTCQQLRALPGCADVPVLFVTSLRSSEAEERGFATGAVDYVHKPYTPTLLLARVRTHLELRRAVAEARAHELEAHALLDVLMPPAVARELRETGTVRPYLRDDVAVLFADLVGFTAWCSQRSAPEVVARLQIIMVTLEDIARKHGVEKLKTVGDAFMGAVGLLEADADSLGRSIACGREMAAAVDRLGGEWALRVGVHRGPVVAGIIGRERYRFDIWGDTVNLASRLCDHARPGHVCVSRAAGITGARSLGRHETVEMRGVGEHAVVQIPGPGRGTEPG